MIAKGDEKSNTKSPYKGICGDCRRGHSEMDSEESKKAPTGGRGFYCE